MFICCVLFAVHNLLYLKFFVICCILGVVFCLQISPPCNTRNHHAKYKRRARPTRSNHHVKYKSRAKPPGSACEAQKSGEASNKQSSCEVQKSGLAPGKYKRRVKPQLAIDIGETSSFSDVYGTTPTMSVTRTTVTRHTTHTLVVRCAFVCYVCGVDEGRGKNNETKQPHQ